MTPVKHTLSSAGLAPTATSSSARAPRPSTLNSRPSTLRGFTLIELLITISIIGLLTSFGLAALYQAQEKARETKTKTTIYKLHTAMMQRWESYHYRRLPISIQPGERLVDITDSDGVPGRGFIWRQLNVRRDIMRIELPDRWSDVNRLPVTGISRTPLSRAYLRYYNSRLPNINETNEDAECLYMILSMGEDTSLVSEQLSHADVGDKDGDGAQEFLDAWGNPIRFLRWPAGFVPENPYGPSNPLYVANFVSVDSALQGVIAGTAGAGTLYEEHDPFDTRNVHNPARNPPATQVIETLAYAIYPLIYSPGPDGIPDILHKIVNASGTEVFVALDSNGNLDPYRPVTDPTNSSQLTMIGQPFDRSQDGLQHLDNIHNHLKPQR